MSQNKKKINTVIVGCGNVANRYATQIKSYPQVDLLGFCDIDKARAEQFASEHGGKVYPALEDVLADDSIDLVVNLTIHFAHVEVITRCLQAGKHVHTEKPLATSYADAQSLVDLAREKGLRLSSAPITYMGEAQQTAWKILRENKLGKVRLIYAEINHGRIESWHPNPGPFYEVGVLWDVGVYPLTLITTFFGPVRKVLSYGQVIYPDRVNMEGKPFHISTPDCTISVLELECGAVVRLTANFYAKNSKQGGSLEMHGDDGMLYLGNFQAFNTGVEYARYGDEFAAVELIRTPYEGTEYGRGVDDMATAMLNAEPQRATGAQAAHVVEILEALSTSMKTGKKVAVTSNFPQPDPMAWAL